MCIKKIIKKKQMKESYFKLKEHFIYKGFKKNGRINMRVMIDTNIFISSILFPNSLPARLVEDVLYKHNLVLCSQIIEELHEVFGRYNSIWI